jgi:hypothetical protein
MSQTDLLLPVNSNPEINPELATLIMVIALKNSLTLHRSKIDVLKVFNELLFYKPIARILESISPNNNVNTKIELIKVLLAYHYRNSKKIRSTQGKKALKSDNYTEHKYVFVDTLNVLLDNNIVNNLLHVNEFDGITYFNKENFEELLRWLFLFNTLALKADTDENDEKKFLQEIKKLAGAVNKLINTAEESGYDLNKLRGEIVRVAESRSSKTKKRRTKNQ